MNQVNVSSIEFSNNVLNSVLKEYYNQFKTECKRILYERGHGFDVVNLVDLVPDYWEVCFENFMDATNAVNQAEDTIFEYWKKN